MNTKTLIAIVAAVAIAGAAVFSILSLTEVTDRGKGLRPYESGPVFKIRIADSITAYADKESKPDSDTISGSILVALATGALLVLLVLRLAGAEPRLRLFYGLAATAFAFLAFDELAAVHETVGHNLPFLADLPGVERPDDVVFALWLIPAAAFIYLFRDILLATPRLRRLFGAAFAAFVLAVLTDLTGSVLDDPLEIVSAACIIAGFASMAAAHLEPCIRAPAEASGG